MLDPQRRVRRAEHVLAERADQRTVLLRLRDGHYYALDEVSTRIWELCAEGATLASVVDAIFDEFEAPRETIEADVSNLIEELIDETLLVIDAPHS